MADNNGLNSVLNDSTGNSPEVSKSLKVTNRSIETTDQAFSVAETLVNDWKKGILNSARITAKLNGERPYNQKKLDDGGKSWKTNISTGFLATECRKIVPRLFMPIKTAKYLTAAELPAGWEGGPAKSMHFQQTITDAVRAWPKFNFYIRGLCREFGTFGFAFNVWFDQYEWRPNLLRMDRGFVPQGTEIMESPGFFMAKWDYKPHELLDILKESLDNGRDEWDKNATVKAIIGALPPPVDATYPNARTYEELIRQATWAFSYTKGVKLIRTWHLFSKEATGKVSHYVLLADRASNSGSASGTGGNSPPPAMQGGPEGDNRMLFKAEDQFDSMDEVVNTFVFDFGDGTVHGSWGAGQILYDLSAQVEKIRCDSIDNLRLTNKIKAQVTDAKNINDVKLTINDQIVIVSGAQFAGNTAGMAVNTEGYEALDQKLTQIAQQKIGAFVPPIPLQPSDIKAAQINAAMAQEKELQEDMLENCLIQFAAFMKIVTKRLCNVESPDEVAKQVQETLHEKLTDEEIVKLVNSYPVKTVSDYTEYKAQNRAMFAKAVLGNPLFKQDVLARIMAEGIGDERFVESVVTPQGDNSDQINAQHQQILENGPLSQGTQVPVLAKDNDWVHMQGMAQPMQQMLQNPQMDPKMAENMLQHYAAHYSQGVGKKGLPEPEINNQKKIIAQAEKIIQAHKERIQIAQKGQILQKIQEKQQHDQLVGQAERTGAIHAATAVGAARAHAHLTGDENPIQKALE